jgi:hypothetical protein
VDEDTIRRRAEEHAQAVVAGDLRRAGRDLSEEAARHAPAIMAALPRPLTGCEVVEVRAADDGYRAAIDYRGEGASTTVVSRWRDVSGDPTIVALELAPAAD